MTVTLHDAYAMALYLDGGLGPRTRHRPGRATYRRRPRPCPSDFWHGHSNAAPPLHRHCPSPLRRALERRRERVTIQTTGGRRPPPHPLHRPGRPAVGASRAPSRPSRPVELPNVPMKYNRRREWRQRLVSGRRCRTTGGAEIDPLALSAVHDSAADEVLPFIVAPDRRAHDFPWVLVGSVGGRGRRALMRDLGALRDLREGPETAWRLLWRRATRFTGIDAIRRHYEARRTDLSFKLVSNQRSQGLLVPICGRRKRCGAGRSAVIVADRGGRGAVANGAVPGWHGANKGTAGANAFDCPCGGIHEAGARELGAALFDPEPMRLVAAAIRQHGRVAAWRHVARRRYHLRPGSGPSRLSLMTWDGCRGT